METGFLELHHLEPYALGGATTIDGVTLRCRPHNLYAAEQEFGVERTGRMPSRFVDVLVALKRRPLPEAVQHEDRGHADRHLLPGP